MKRTAKYFRYAGHVCIVTGDKITLGARYVRGQNHPGFPLARHLAPLPKKLRAEARRLGLS